ncbi:hypothetical protein SAMN05216302_10805 [Nitrosomonas aestuarii]|uniref:Uncharacterized protein n=1 Tax=Nitrosomonas aestuarii TaxID=52441 RepID=A0A1I4HE08_9PROT|nr:hypothetical protein [Nitrosomonas aestuarii]SFL40538.1 hypothetical protein SAMN05216302_10805 [Nitrosomonas aestuarii]
MFFKKIFLIIILIFCYSHLIASETNNSAPNTNQENELDANKLTQAQQSAKSKKNNSLKENQQPNTEKKPNMVDYCRKHTC